MNRSLKPVQLGTGPNSKVLIGKTPYVSEDVGLVSHETLRRLEVGMSKVGHKRMLWNKVKSSQDKLG